MVERLLLEILLIKQPFKINVSLHTISEWWTHKIIAQTTLNQKIISLSQHKFNEQIIK